MGCNFSQMSKCHWPLCHIHDDAKSPYEFDPDNHLTIEPKRKSCNGNLEMQEVYCDYQEDDPQLERQTSITNENAKIPVPDNADIILDKETKEALNKSIKIQDGLANDTVNDNKAFEQEEDEIHDLSDLQLNLDDLSRISSNPSLELTPTPLEDIDEDVEEVHEVEANQGSPTSSRSSSVASILNEIQKDEEKQKPAVEKSCSCPLNNLDNPPDLVRSVSTVEQNVNNDQEKDKQIPQCVCLQSGNAEDTTDLFIDDNYDAQSLEISFGDEVYEELEERFKRPRSSLKSIDNTVPPLKLDPIQDHDDQHQDVQGEVVEDLDTPEPGMLSVELNQMPATWRSSFHTMIIPLDNKP